MDADALARWLVIAGILITLAGGLLFLLARIPFFGRLPGDISIEGDGFRIWAPLASMLLVSLILTVLLNIILRLK